MTLDTLYVIKKRSYHQLRIKIIALNHPYSRISIFFRGLYCRLSLIFRLFKIELRYANAGSNHGAEKERAHERSTSRHISRVRGLQTTRVARFISWRVIHLAAPRQGSFCPSLLFITFLPSFAPRASFASKKLWMTIADCQWQMLVLVTNPEMMW